MVKLGQQNTFFLFLFAIFSMHYTAVKILEMRQNDRQDRVPYTNSYLAAYLTSLQKKRKRPEIEA